jgi:Tat protein secretion system quality control protein TatD with DNase activity
VAKQVADLRGLSETEVGRISSENFDRLFVRVVSENGA